jgi:tryptophanyl-tRNA synthetase
MKMSASKGEKHNIDIFSDPERIRKQVRSAVTDTGEAPGAAGGNLSLSPGVENLFTLLKASRATDAYDYLLDAHNSGNLKYVELKDAVADALITMSDPFRAKRLEIIADKRAFKDQVKASSEGIRAKAKHTLKEVKEMIGLL